jgi:hypothetical protein
MNSHPRARYLQDKIRYAGHALSTTNQASLLTRPGVGMIGRLSHLLEATTLTAVVPSK